MVSAVSVERALVSVGVDPLESQPLQETNQLSQSSNFENFEDILAVKTLSARTERDYGDRMK